ncbi:MAG TPA: hypothetical protein VML19_05805 [Verrucomicrobiae bacterium]|nr:hypothetical protein [Verrucomicrobiae bacterium]
MKRNLLLLSLLLVCGVLGARMYKAIEPHPQLAFGSAGITELRYRGWQLLSYGDLRVSHVIMRDASGRDYPAPLDSTLQSDAAAGTVVRKFGWGEVEVRYTPKAGRLNIAVTVRNRSADTLREASYEPLALHFPARVAEYDGAIPLVGHNVGDPTIISMSWPNGKVVLANDDVVRPLLAGFPWSIDRPANATFPLRICTGRDPMLPDMLPFIDRPVPPGSADSYSLSLRFGSPDATVEKMADDILKSFAAHFPPQLKWKDRRPVGTVFLSTSGLGAPKNPRGWLLDKTLDVTTEAGREAFRTRILDTADSTVAILRNMNAQGAITWDIEGQEFPAASYAGDPRLFAKLAPEMAGVADEYFRRIREAGFRVGVTVRPQQIVFDDQHRASEVEVPDPGRLLEEKIRWARERWGATLFFVDSNGGPSRPLDAAVLEKVAADIPDVLLVPEHKNVRYFAFSAPYFSLRDGLVSTPAVIRAVYPNAFSFVNTADGPIVKRRDELTAAVKQGDVLLYRSWYEDPANAEVKSLY